jgi:DNA-binding response OmpR family regulator
MSSPPAGPVPRHIIVADEDRVVVALVIKTLREDGHAVFHAYDVLAATQLVFAIEPCDLVLTNTRVEGADGVELVVQLRRKRPTVPIIYLATNGRSTAEIERQLPADVPILREPFTAEKLRAAVNAMLNGKGT